MRRWFESTMWLGVLVTALAVAVRVLWVLVVPSKPVGDFAMYLESGRHLLEHRALDPEFVYMPGYVALVAAIFAVGGGLLSVKLVGAVLAGLAAGAIVGLTATLADRRSALVAGLGYALWPAGIAVSSVTGTDMPTGALLVIAVWTLVILVAAGRRWTAAVAFGVLLGLCSYVRAVALPLSAFGVFYLRAAGDPWRRALARSALSTGVALVLLAPWGLRNHARYGEWLITDSHGGLTALVGANPNTEGRYSRSLNLMFKEVTGYTLLAEPHREADRASYALAKRLTAFSPGYAAGLVVEKARRLLAQERALLYWPVYRAGVLRSGAVRGWLERERRPIERLVDGFWALLVGAAAAGTGAALATRRWALVAFLPMVLALIGVYALYFAEVRYHLAFAPLLFPLAGWAIARVVPPLGRGVDRRMWLRQRRTPALAGVAAVLLVAAGWPTLLWAGQRLRERHRFAAHVCEVSGKKDLCLWRTAGAGDSAVIGVHDGVGLSLARPTQPGERLAAVSELPSVMPAGALEVRAAVDLLPSGTSHGPPAGEATLSVGGQVVARAPLEALATAAARGEPISWQATVHHPGGPVRLELAVAPAVEGATPERSRVWLCGLSVRARP